ncbi:hypothetical protein MMC22_003789 [Lobaria immixta]|nr:hypothetical protein [Lobaria immixta]
MEFTIFYAFFIVLATVSAAPVDNDQTVGLDGITTLCDSSTEDCPLIFKNNDYTISTIGLDQGFGGAGAKKPSAFPQLNFFATATSDSLEADGSVTQPDTTTGERPGVTAAATYDCEEPYRSRKDGHPFHNVPPENEGPSLLYKKRSANDLLPADVPGSISCTKQAKSIRMHALRSNLRGGYRYLQTSIEGKRIRPVVVSNQSMQGQGTGL